MTALLEVNHVGKRFGGLRAVDDVSFEVAGGSILGLIGPNGSGKTTLLSVLSGTLRPEQGEVVVDGAVVSGRGPRAAVHAGVARTFQTTRLFPTWTLRRAMRLAHGERRRAGLDPVDHDVLEMFDLDEHVERPCASLNGALQRRAMIVCALATSPRVLLLDEPAVGMDADEADLLAAAIRRVRTELGTTIVIVDHNMHFLMPIADRVIVMSIGTVLASGTPAEVRADEAVIASYLGS